MIFSLNDDLIIQNFNDIKTVLVHQILEMSVNQKIKTAKRLGYQLSQNNK